ncbi:MAG TPA: head decoration protein [Pirellulaceae bacterium]|nr:head decoration protein [Pirellulaceae bacterium]
MSEFASGSAPGFVAEVEAAETNVLWVGRHGQDLAATRKITLLASSIDSDNSPTSTLRGGNVLAIIDSSGKATLYDPDATDGTQIAVGILEKPQSMLVDGTATDRFTQMLVHGLVKEGELLGLDPRGKQQLGLRCTFDRETSPQAGVLMHPRGIYRKSTNYTVVAGDNGLLFLATAAATFTLPTKENGLAFRFAQTADANLVIQGSADLIHKGNAAANTVTFSTASEKIGSQVLVECLYTNTGTLKWLVTNLGATTPTVA